MHKIITALASLQTEVTCVTAVFITIAMFFNLAVSHLNAYTEHTCFDAGKEQPVDVNTATSNRGFKSTAPTKINTLLHQRFYMVQ
jgi:hypothetical protein